MALSDPRIIYGVHSFSPYKRKSGEFYGTVRVIGDSSVSLAGELVTLNGGSNKYPFAIEDGVISAELALKFKEYPDFAFELFLGKAPTANAAESGASATTITNVNGTTVVSTAGIASVGVLSGSEADVKFGKYIVKAVSATTVDVFLSSDVDITRGTDGEFQNDLLKITASPLTITAATPVTIPNFGLELTGDAGAIAMTTDDTAEFYARPINTGSLDATFGAGTDLFPEFGAICMSQKRGSEAMFEVELFRVKAIGLPLPLAEKAFAEPEVTAQAFFDSAKNGVLKIRHVDTTPEC